MKRNIISKEDKTYTSLEELRDVFGLPPIRKRTNDEEKLKSQQEDIVGKCKVCGSLLSWIEGTNVCACKNPSCKGIKMSSTNDDGTERIWYIPVTKRLSEKGMKRAERLFDK